LRLRALRFSSQLQFASCSHRVQSGVRGLGRLSFECRCAVELSQVAAERLDDVRSTTATKELNDD
jgi:hypothetical protein